MPPKFAYPIAAKGTVTDDFHGTTVADPYRWMEDPDAEDVKKWVDAENVLTQAFLAGSSSRADMQKQLEAMINYPKYGCPRRHGDNYYYYYNTGLQNQFVLYTAPSLDAEAKIFFDPNALSKDGTVSMATSSFSEDGTLWAYGLSSSGSDWVTIRVRNVASGKDYDDKIEWVKFSGITWTHDNAGFFYGRYPEPAKAGDAGTEVSSNTDHMLYYHKLGTPQSDDVLIYKDPEHPMRRFGAEMTDKGDMVVVTVSESTAPKNLLWYAPLPEKWTAAPNADALKWTKVIDEFEAEYDLLANDGTSFVLKTNSEAPRYKVIVMDVAKGPSSIKELIPQHETDVLEYVMAVDGDKLAVVTMKDVAHSFVLRSMKDGSLIESVKLPTLGTISALSGERKYSELFYGFTSFLHPGVQFRYDVAANKSSVYREIKLPGFDPSKYRTEQVFYPSKDGTKIPMFIVESADLDAKTPAPTWLYGYGGFSISLTPYFSVLRLAWVAGFGGRYCLANLRGGGEYGEDWHEAGTLTRKQNVFDDFHAAAEYLVETKRSQKESLFINGGSNGGLLVGACINQRPELYGAAVADVGVMDMLRFHRFTIGKAWCSDYGNADESKEQFEALYKYSPVHNAKWNGKSYPATLLKTADHDDRVSPLHSFKYAAALQANVGSQAEQTAPLMIRIETKAGHGAGKPLAKVIEEYCDMFAFLELTLKDVKWKGLGVPVSPAVPAPPTKK